MLCLKILRDRLQRAFVADGYLLLKDIVPEPLVLKAKRAINKAVGAARQAVLRSSGDAERDAERITSAGDGLKGLGSTEEVVGLFTESPLLPLMEDLMGGPVAGTAGARDVATVDGGGGRIAQVLTAQIALNFPSEEGEAWQYSDFNEAGYRDQDTPFYGWHGHLDGVWNGGGVKGVRHAGGLPLVTPDGEPLTDEHLKQWYSDPATNGGRRSYTELALSVPVNMANYTCLLGVPLSDQMAEGSGNLGLLRGAHFAMEHAFRKQRDAGGPLGPGGPGWPLEDLAAPNGHGLCHYPDSVRAQFEDGAAYTPDGKMWPRPSFILCEPRDAVLVLHSTPHCATRVEAADPRSMVYFRLTPAARPEANRACFPEAMCDIWLEWPALAEMGVEARDAATRARARPPDSHHAKL